MGCAAIARSAKFFASAFLLAENLGPGTLFSGEFFSQMNVDADGRCATGWRGHSASSPAGGLMTAQLANVIVRDHR